MSTIIKHVLTTAFIDADCLLMIDGVADRGA
jgi:hypothetical protein